MSGEGLGAGSQELRFETEGLRFEVHAVCHRTSGRCPCSLPAWGMGVLFDVCVLYLYLYHGFGFGWCSGVRVRKMGF